jgi:hypothetical protein
MHYAPVYFGPYLAMSWGCSPAGDCPFPCLPFYTNELRLSVTTFGCYVNKGARISTMPTPIYSGLNLIPFFLRKFKRRRQFTLENMSNDKPTTEHIEYASVQEHQGSDAIDTSASSIHGSADGTSTHSATKDDTQTGTQRLIDDTKNNLEKEKSTPRVMIREKTANTAFSTSSKQPKLHGRTRKCFPGLLKSCEDRWVFEVICCLFALCNLLAIITILAVHQEKSLPHWPYVISMNSLVSIFTALMKAAMMLVVSAGM